MALTESLRILITANGAQAEREFTKVGAAAKTSLGQAESSAQKWGRTLTTAGIAMVTFGGVALAGLFKAAQAAQEEDLAIAKLNNSISQSPELAGASADAFLEQAAALQDLTKFSDDATIAAQAMLGTFHLTQSEIIGLTPLVQDLASKFDIDLNRASILVGKAMDGNSGALGRMGVNIDETAFATDRYSAVLTALRENAGGFAETEGRTFNGQLAIMKNNLGDISEGIGRGAVEAFNSLLGPVKALSDTFADLSPSTQSLIGKTAAFGAAALVVAGSASTLSGVLLKLGISVSALPVAIVAAGAALAIWGHSMVGFQTDVAELEDTMHGGQAAIDEMAQQMVALGSNEDIRNALTELFAVDPQAAANLSNAIEMTGESGGFTVNVMRDLEQEARRAALGLDENATSAEENAAALDALNKSIDDYLGVVQGTEEANATAAESQQALFQALVANGNSFDVNTQKGRDNIAARNAWVDAVAGQVQAASDFAAAGGNEEVAQRRANNAIGDGISALARARDQGLITAAQFRDLSATMRGIPHTISIHVDSNVEFVRREFDLLAGSIANAGAVAASHSADFHGVGETAPTVHVRGGVNESAPAGGGTALTEEGMRRVLERTVSPVVVVQ